MAEGHSRSSLVDVLDRVLDKGLAVAGDIKVSLAEVELPTIRIRPLICSIDRGGADWSRLVEVRSHLSSGKQALSAENEELKKEIRVLERKLAQVTRRRSTVATLK